MSARILLLDIERTPAWTKPLPVWDMKALKYKYLGPGDIETWSRTICHAYKWLGDRTVSFMAEWEDGGRKGFLERTSALLEEADLIVGHNMRDFDLPHLTGELILENLPVPPLPKVFDTLRTMQKHGNLENNQLDTLDKRFGFTGKTDRYRIEMAMAAVNGDEKAQKRIERYAKGDIKATERVYLRLRPLGRVNLGLFADDPTRPVCPHCESKKVQRRGYSVKSALRYPRLHCQSCGGWSTAKTAIKEAGSVELRP